MKKWMRWGLTSLTSMMLGMPLASSVRVYAQVNVQDDIKDDLYLVDTLVSDQHVKYPAFYEAYEDMKVLASHFEMQDLIIQKENGTTLEEYEADVPLELEGDKRELTEDDQIILYKYPAEEGEDYEGIELLVYFKKNRMAYLGLFVKQKEGDLVLPNLHYSDGEQILAWMDEEPLPKMDQLADKDFEIIGLSHMVFDGGALNTLLLPNTLNDEEAIDTVVFYDYTIMNSIADDPIVVSGMANQLMLDTSILWASAAVAKQVNTGEYNFR